MDFMNRGGRPVQQNTQTNTPGVSESPRSSGKSGRDKDGKWAKVTYVSFLTVVALLVLAVIVGLVFIKKEPKEISKVDGTKLQAVFLNGGQVYFGKINDINPRSLSLNNIYYLRVNQQVQPNQSNNNSANDISLVKLGCELHGPQDSMVINRDQVIFWENLKNDGQVAKAVAEYVKANPNGQKCDQQTNNNSNSNTNTNSTTPTTNTNNSSTNSTKKP